MVMRNRYEGSGSPQWWDDLPPRVRQRFTPPRPGPELPTRSSPPAPPAAAPEPVPERHQVLLDLTRFAALFVLASVIILFYLLIALSYVKA
ncbi:MAG: hypothetical protein RMJ56_12895 [Gemmataceae bacterium]|nr:hypothetical protein [Gemmata sp.]MDW8198492.1 hypothetical protein [Gemmataceae bacterium]